MVLCVSLDFLDGKLTLNDQVGALSPSLLRF